MKQEEIFMGSAGSLTVGILLIAVVFLMRSFYKRYMRMNARQDENPTDN